MTSIRVLGLIALCMAPCFSAGAQVTIGAPHVMEAVAGSELERYLRVLQTAGDAPAGPWSLRAFSLDHLSRLTTRTSGHPWSGRYARVDSQRMALVVLRPSARVRYNSSFPFGGNEWGVWNGRGLTSSLRAGIAFTAGPFSAVIAPYAFRSENGAFDLAPDTDAATPFADPARPLSVDLPQRFGDEAYQRIDWGQSTVALTGFGVTTGISTANQWWGPASTYPFLFSNNAPGFAHVFAGTSRPLDVRLVRLSGRVVWGRLEQSEYFTPTGLTRPRRFGTGMILVVQPGALPGIEFGGARFFHAPYPDSGLSGRYFRRVFEGFLKSKLPESGGSTSSDKHSLDGENQLAAIFLRWVAPRRGFEAHVELGRDDHAWDLRDLLIMPDRQSALGFGAGKTWAKDSVRRTVLRFEQLSMLPNAIARVDQGFAHPNFYTHSAGTNQGHTHRGQLLGANVGAGSASGAELAWDQYTTSGRTSFSWQRIVRRDKRATLPDSTRDPQAYDVQHALTGERLLFRGKGEILAGATWVFELNRDFVRDARNLSLYVSVTGIPTR